MNPFASIVDIASAEIGIHEIGSTNRGPRVDQYLDATNCGTHGVPWCSGFVCWCLRVWIGKNPGVTALTDSRRFNTAGAYELLAQGRNLGQLVFTPATRKQWGGLRKGDICVFEFAPGEHHCGICREDEGGDGMAYTIDGNTTAPRQVGDERNGGCVAAKARSVSTVCGIIRLVPVAQPVS